MNELKSEYLSSNCRENSNDVINICYSSDKNYAKFLAVSIASVLSSKAETDDICFYILDGGLREKDKNSILNLKQIANCEIKFVNVDMSKFENCPIRRGDHISLAAYYRLLIQDFLPDIDKILYLDCDLVVKSSLKDLYSTDCGDYYFAAVKDSDEAWCLKRLKNLEEYYNSGVLLMNLSKFRQTKFSEHIFDWILENKRILKLHDQDSLNICCKGMILPLDEKWNSQQKYKIDFQGMNIVHFVGRYKYPMVFFNIDNVFQTKYVNSLLANSVIAVFRKCFRAIGYWFFRLANHDETTKHLTVFGFNFYFKRKAK